MLQHINQLRVDLMRSMRLSNNNKEDSMHSDRRLLSNNTLNSNTEDSQPQAPPCRCPSSRLRLQLLHPHQSLPLHQQLWLQ